MKRAAYGFDTGARTDQGQDKQRISRDFGGDAAAYAQNVFRELIPYRKIPAGQADAFFVAQTAF